MDKPDINLVNNRCLGWGREGPHLLTIGSDGMAADHFDRRILVFLAVLLTTGQQLQTARCPLRRPQMICCEALLACFWVTPESTNRKTAWGRKGEDWRSLIAPLVEPLLVSEMALEPAFQKIPWSTKKGDGLRGSLSSSRRSFTRTRLLQ